MTIEEDLEATRKQYKDKITNILNKACKNIFETFGGLQAFSFYIYQPSFNDGDPITSYLCNDPENIRLYYTDENSIEINTLEYDNKEEEDYDYEESEEERKEISKLEQEITEKISNILQPFTSNDIEYLFGTNNKIIIYRDGKIQAEDYNPEY